MDGPMEQPSTPTTTTIAAASTAFLAEHDEPPVSSPDPPSTRPNPFDDSDISARKRRRTSASASPAPQLSIAPIVDMVADTSLDSTLPHVAPSIPTEQPPGVVPHTPHTDIDKVNGDSPIPPSSSQVTLSLRRAACHTGTSEPASPTPNQECALESTTGSQERNNSPTMSEPVGETPQLSDSASPPVELIAISDNEPEGGMDFSIDDAIILSSCQNTLPYNPMPNFPFTESGEEPMASLQRLINYLSSDSLADSKIVASVQMWIEEYLAFARSADTCLVGEAREAYRAFWIAFPAVTLQFSIKSPDFAKSNEARDVLVGYYSSFSSLTACMVNLDLQTFQQWISTEVRDRQCPEVYCARYLQQLHDILSIDACLVCSSDVTTPAFGWSRNDSGNYLVRNLQSGSDGIVANLSQLAALLAGLVPEMPKMMENLAPISQILSDSLQEAARIVSGTFGPELQAQARQQLEIGHTIWNAICEDLDLVLEKHVTHLGSDTAVALLQSLTDLLKCTMRGSHQQALDQVERYAQSFPETPAVYRVDAIVWQWRINVLEKAIRSSQMQLRVMAISKLCTDLVTVWKNASDAGNDEGIKFLEQLGLFVLQTGLIKYIFGSNCHPEIIVESSNILGFLIVVKMYTQDLTDEIWQVLSVCQDPRVSEALARMVTHITNLFDYEALMGWCEKFQTLPLEGFTPAMRILWENVMNDIVLRCQTERHAPSLQPYALCLRLLRVASLRKTGLLTADADLQFAAIQKLRDLFSLGPDGEDRNSLYLSCIEDISQKSATSLGSLWFLYIATRGSAPREIQQLTEQHDLTKIVIEELAYSAQSSRQAEAFAILSNSSNMPRRELVACVIQLQPTLIDNELGKQLLDSLIGPDSPCAEDRKAGWFVVINAMKKSSFKNPFLQICFTRYLPSLSAACFSDGMLEFIRERVLSLAGDDDDCALDDPDSQSQTGIEQLWRIILEAEDLSLVSQAILTLAVDLYMESGAMRSYSPARCKKLHVSLVTRCLTQMKKAADRIQGSYGVTVTNTAPGTTVDNTESMTGIDAKEDLHKEELVFKRSLQLLRIFLEKHQAHPRYSLADLRTLIPKSPDAMKGSLAELKYQAFDDNEATAIKVLQIGVQNTAACLLAQCQRETGFENFRLYFLGQALLLTEHQNGQALEDLGIRDHLLLVKKEGSTPLVVDNVKPGSSQLEIEVLCQFDDMWEYLSMEQTFAEEIYDFLVQLPADWPLTQQFDSGQLKHTDVFLKRHPFKILYAIHAIRDHVAMARRRSLMNPETGSETSSSVSYQQTLGRALRLVVDAIGDPEILDGLSLELQLRIAGSLLQTFVTLFDEAVGSGTFFQSQDRMMPTPTRLVDILSLTDGETSDKSLALIDRTVAAILRLGSASNEICTEITSGTDFLQTLVNFVLRDPRKAVRHSVCRLIEGAVIPRHQHLILEPGQPASGVQQQSHEAMLSSLSSAFLAALPGLLDHCSHPEEYFLVLRCLIERSYSFSRSAIDAERLARVTLDLLLEHTSIESIDTPDVSDPVATGLISILYFCLQSDENVARSEKIDDITVSKLFWRHLFPRKRRGQGDEVPKIIVSTPTRRKLYEILFRLVRFNLNAFYHMMETLNGLVPFYNKDPDDPYLYELPMHFDRSRAVRAPCGYVGLRNLSNTCYLNSLLTQLFMNLPFRSFMLSVVVGDPEGSQQLLFYTQKLFGYMQESYQRFVDPFSVVTSIKTYDDTLIDIHSQMDVDEFYNLLFDRWEGQLHDGEIKKQLRSFFGGQLVQQVKSMECQHISERLEPFSAIQCDIKGKTTLQDSLQAYVDGEIMEGDNKYKCSTCDRHVDAVKRACLKDLPDNLIFHLKRFDFNIRTMQRNKINDYFAFPLTLDMMPYTVDSLNGQGHSDPSSSDLFELVGVLVHSGTAESGHYYSYVRERGTPDSSRWVEFNDDTVSSWDPTLLETSTFGGPDPQNMHDTNGMFFDKTYSAYMLFYQRSSNLVETQASVATTAGEGPIKCDVDPPLKEHILEENKIFLRRHCLFDHSHTFFVQQCFGHAIALGEKGTSKSKLADEDANDGNLKAFQNLKKVAMELALSHFDQVVTRAKDTPFLGTFSSLLRQAIMKSSDCALAYCRYFDTRHASFRSLLQRNQDVEIRALSGKMFLLAVEHVRSSLPGHYYSRGSLTIVSSSSGEESSEEWEQALEPLHSVVDGTIGIFNYLWKFFHVHIRAWDEYFGTVLDFAKLGEPEVGHLLSQGYLLKLLRIIIADPREELPSNYQRMLANLVRRFNSKPASYTAILALIDYLLSQLEPILGMEAIVDDPRERLAMRKPFAWSSDEIQAVHHHPERHASSFFVEKLLELDQAHDLSKSIIGRLVSSGEELDMKVFNTLRRKIQSDTSTKVMDTALQAAGRYMSCSRSTERVQMLISHICAQASGFQRQEGSVFLSLMESLLQNSSENRAMDRAKRAQALGTMPLWAPFLLVYGNERIRTNAESLISKTLFQPWTATSIGGQRDDDDDKNNDDNDDDDADVSEDVGAGSDDNAAPDVDDLQGVIRQLGIGCVAYLRDYHVKRKSQLERGAAATISKVVSKCAPFYKSTGDLTGVDEDSAEFAAIRGEIKSPLQRLVVDEVEEEGSDWDGSCGSSELMDTTLAAAAAGTAMMG